MDSSTTLDTVWAALYTIYLVPVSFKYYYILNISPNIQLQIYDISVVVVIKH